MGFRVSIIGASGYAGGELIRLVDDHPNLDIGYLGAHTKAGKSLGEVHPHLGGGDRVLQALDPTAAAGADLVFLALPHGASAGPAMEVLEAGTMVVDLGSDFRLDTPQRYQAAYGGPHPFPEQLGAWPYALPELFGDALVGSDRAAVPGCYPTSALLATGPLVAAGLVGSGPIIVDSMSGVSGGGRGAKEHLMFGAVDEGVTAYGVLTHRHRHEMEQGLGAVAPTEPIVIFTPHLVPMQRGILSTCYLPAAPGVTGEAARRALAAHYAGRPFVDVIESPPVTRWVVGSNRALISCHFDDRTNTIITISAIDNLLKGAAGQAVQAANLMLGLSETVGLPVTGWMP